MAARFGFAIALTLLAVGTATAQPTIIVQDNFDQYANSAAFKDVWVPTIGVGTAPAEPQDVDAGLLTSDPLSNAANFPGVQGQAVDHIGGVVRTPNPGMVNQWGGVIDQLIGENPAFNVVVNSTTKVVLSADIFVGTSGNERMSVGLRHVTAVADTGADPDSYPDATTRNIFEMGVYNDNPTVVLPGFPTVTTGYGFRINGFGTATAPYTSSPNWQYFTLPPELERTTDLDELVTVGDVGAGWHRYTATFTDTDVTISIDLFRDGLRNTSRTPDPGTGIRPGTEGIDASVVLPIKTQTAGFNSLRIGGPSGLTSAGTGAMGFDNILLQTEAVAAPLQNADFNGDNIVDGKDFLIWQRGFGAAGTLATGDANNDTLVNDADLAIFKTQFGTDPTPVVGAVAAVPEPTTIALAGVAVLGTLASARRRK